MLTKILLSASVICATLVHCPLQGDSPPSHLKDYQQQTSDVSNGKITEVIYIDDEHEPEMFLTLDNGLRLLTKVTFGHSFYAGQSIRVTLEDAKLKLILTTYESDGKAKEVISFFRIGNTHFYQEL